uniref:Uncharacterized protein n=1 Tax=Meloidogyne incognita TaxID=6306 RepID=A0A914KHR4_MELIC
MAEIEEQFYNIWKQMSLNESLDSRDRSKLAVWDYPVSDKFTNMWRFMQESRLPQTVDDAIYRVLNSERGFAFIGDAMEIKYATLTNCRLQQAILGLQNERRLETCKERWWHHNVYAKECESTDDDSNGISVQNIGGVFLVILAGICISMLCLLGEYIYYSRLRNPNGKRETSKHLAQITRGLGCLGALTSPKKERKDKQCQQFSNSAFNVD